MQPVFFNRTYDEAMSLLVESRDYLAGSEPDERARLTIDARLAMNCEAMRLTSRLTQVMAWLLIQKAVHAGELTAQQAAEEEHRLSGQAVCHLRTEWASGKMPTRLQSLLDRSYLLYCRVERLDEMVAASARAA